MGEPERGLDKGQEREFEAARRASEGSKSLTGGRKGVEGTDVPRRKETTDYLLMRRNRDHHLL